MENEKKKGMTMMCPNDGWKPALITSTITSTCVSIGFLFGVAWAGVSLVFVGIGVIAFRRFCGGRASKHDRSKTIFVLQSESVPADSSIDESRILNRPNAKFAAKII